MLRRIALLIAVVLSLVVSTSAIAQQSGQSAIVGSGTSTVKQKPTLLRMRVQLSEKASTAEEALQKLADRKEAARLQLESLGASADSIKLADATFPTGESDTQQQMRQMAMYQMRSRGRVPEGLKPVKSVTVVSTVTAEWPLEQGTNQEMLVYVTGLKDKVVEADLAGMNEPKELTPEEEELRAEMEEMGGMYAVETESPGEPTFFYVAPVSEEARKKAMADAFAKAKSQAEMLAAAAGVNLGPLQSLSTGPSSSASSYDYDYAQYMSMYYGVSETEESSDNEVVSASPDSLALRASVQASFAIE